MLFARQLEAAKTLSARWQTQVGKTYRALAAGTASQDDYEIAAPIGTYPHPKLGKIFAAHPAGKPALSRARVLERREASTLFEVELVTGRPHQIRIHLAIIGHPLVGDPVYTAGGRLLASPGLPGDGGYLLHAETLRFQHPVTGERLELSAPVPEGLQKGKRLTSQDP